MFKINDRRYESQPMTRTQVTPFEDKEIVLPLMSIICIVSGTFIRVEIVILLKAKIRKQYKID